MPAESIEDILRDVADRCAPAAPQLDPSNFVRIPEEVLFRGEVKGPLKLLGVLEYLNRKFRLGGRLNTTNPQLARICGVSVNTILGWMARLTDWGLIERVGRTCGRVIRLLFSFVKGDRADEGAESHQQPLAQLPGPAVTHQPPLAQLPASIHQGKLADSPSAPGEFTQEVVTSPREERERDSKARSSSSSPSKGDTPTTAKTGGTPPQPAAPPPPSTSPVVEAYHRRDERTKAEDAERLAHWEATPATRRAAIEAKVRAEQPELAAFGPKMLLSLCLAELERIEVETLTRLMDAGDPRMRQFSAGTLCDSGRADLVVERIEFERLKQDGRHTLASVTAAPKSPCR